MTKDTPKGWAYVQDDSIFIDGRRLPIAGLRFVAEIGRGANAAVFEAVDEPLERRVAVKIWNTRGTARAQSETIKIANLNHPLIVSTYRFDRIDDHPYSVMELVAGTSGKRWLEQNPDVAQRTSVWRQYSQALRFIHDRGGIHGDPHLGNVLVFLDTEGIYTGRGAAGEPGVHIKVADTGTSEFWQSYDKILRYEGKLILETACRLFAGQNFAKLWFHPPGLPHTTTLKLLDELCSYISRVHDFVDYDRAAENANRLVTLLMDTPLFELDEVVSQIGQTQVTTVSRFARRLNARLDGIADFLTASDVMSESTSQRYAARRQQFIAGLR